jgi:hypothetical protein
MRSGRGWSPLIPPALPGGRSRKTDMRAAMNAILYLAHRLPVALPATRRFSAALDGLQHLPQVPARGGVGGDLGRIAHGVARADGARSQPLGGGSRQPIGQIRGKGGGKDDAVGYDAGKKVKGRKIHTLVGSEGLPMRVVVHSAAVQDRDGAGLVLVRYAGASLGSN